MREWLDAVVAGTAAFAVSELALSGVVRIATHPRIFEDPTPTATALAFVARLLALPHSVPLRPGPRHFAIFSSLCDRTGARGNLVADAYHAALAIEHGCEWVTLDRDFARFPGLRWRNPLDD